MTMTSVDVDLEVLARAGEILGTKTKRETIAAALSAVLRAEEAEELVDAFRKLEITDSDELRRQAWVHSAEPEA
jgi:Arc/MetJ family transcription regulator